MSKSRKRVDICHYGDYMAECSLDICLHPEHRGANPACKNCPHYISEKDHKIRAIEQQIRMLNEQLKDLRRSK